MFELKIMSNFLIYLTTSAAPVEHETLKSGWDGTTDDDPGRTDVKVEIFI